MLQDAQGSIDAGGEQARGGAVRGADVAKLLEDVRLSRGEHGALALGSAGSGGAGEEGSEKDGDEEDEWFGSISVDSWHSMLLLLNSYIEHALETLAEPAAGVKEQGASAAEAQTAAPPRETLACHALEAALVVLIVSTLEGRPVLPQ